MIGESFASNISPMRSVTFLLAFMIGSITSAQLRYRTQSTLGGGFEVGVPIGEFDHTFGKNIWGFGAQLAFPVSRILPLQGGFDLGYGHLGGDQAVVPVHNMALTATSGNLHINCKVYSYMPFLRFEPLQGKFRPYVDGLIGIRQFVTTSSVKVDGLSQPISSEHVANDVTFSHGWAVGLMMRFGPLAYVEGRVERISSGSATYVDPSSISVSDQGHINFGTLTSRTDVTNIQLGIGLRF